MLMKYLRFVEHNGQLCISWRSVYSAINPSVPYVKFVSQICNRYRVPREINLRKHTISLLTRNGARKPRVKDHITPIDHFSIVANYLGEKARLNKDVWQKIETECYEKKLGWVRPEHQEGIDKLRGKFQKALAILDDQKAREEKIKTAIIKRRRRCVEKIEEIISEGI